MNEEKLSQMFGKKSGLKLLRLLAAAAILGGGLGGLPYKAQALNTVDMVLYNELIFSPSTNDPAVLAKARGLYRDHLIRSNLDPTIGEGYPAYARYLPLDNDNPQRFIGYFVLTSLADYCPLGGCEIWIFENYQGNQWRLAAALETHHVWMGNDPGQGEPADIYVQMSFAGMTGGKPINEDDILHLEWKGREYGP